MPRWAEVRDVLRGPLRVLVLGQVCGQLADGAAQVAFAQLVLFDVGRGATPGRVAAVLAVTLLPYSVVGPLAGAVIDRWRRRSILVTVSRARAVLAVAFAAVAASRWQVGAFVGVLLLLSTSRFVLAGKAAALPRTVPTDRLLTANAVSSLAGMTAAFVGAVAAAGLVGIATLTGFVLAAVAYAAASVVFAWLPDVGGGGLRSPVRSQVARIVAETVDGARYVARRPDIHRPLLAVWTHRLLLGGGFILLVLVTDSRYHLQASGYGLALTVTGVAAFAGTVAAPVLARRWQARALLPLAFLPPAILALVAGYVPRLPALLAAVVAAAFAFQVLKVVTDALVGATSADAVRGRVFATYDVLYNVAFVLAGLLMVPLWHPGAERGLLWGLAAGFLLGWAGFARALGGWPFTAARPAAVARSWRAGAAAVLTGGLPVLTFPAPSWWWLAWVALVPWLLVLRAAPSPRAGAARGFLGGVGFVATVHYWLLPSTRLFFVPLVALVALLWLPWGAAVQPLLHGRPGVRRAMAALVVVPAGWVAVEAVRSWSSLGGPWGLLGASQWRVAPLLAPASAGGVWAVSWLLVAANTALVLLAVTTRARPLAAAALAVSLGAGPLWWALQPPLGGDGSIRVAMVQPGVLHGPAQRLAAEEAMTRRLRPGSADLILWGESSVGFDLEPSPPLLARLTALARDERAPLLARLTALARDERAPLLVNVDARSPTGSIRKRAVLVDATGVRATYDKMRLVPFGEYVPLRDTLGWVRQVSKAAQQNRQRGHRMVLMRVPAARFVPLICFESAFPDMSRQATRMGAQLLVFQTATTTFQGSWAPDQHASLAAVRATETGRPAVQAALSGVTAAFGGDGHRLAWMGQNRQGVLELRVPLAARSTAYVRLGEWVPALAFTTLGTALLAAGLRQARLPAR